MPERFDSCCLGEVVISVIIQAGGVRVISSGLDTENIHKSLQQFLLYVTVAPFNGRAASAAVTARQTGPRPGTSLALEYPIVISNPADFEAYRGLVIENRVA